MENATGERCVHEFIFLLTISGIMKLQVYDLGKDPKKEIGYISLTIDGQLTFSPHSRAEEAYRDIIIQQFFRRLPNTLLVRTRDTDIKKGSVRTHRHYGRYVGSDEPELFLRGVKRKLEQRPVDGMYLYAELVE